MEKNSYFKKIALSSCIYYTAVTFFVLFLYFLINKDLSSGVNPTSLILFLPFSICFAVANDLFRNATLNKPLKVLLHYALTLGGIWFFLFLPNKSAAQSASGAFILFLVLSLLYAIIMTVILVLKGRTERVTREESAYTGVYKKKEK